MNEAMRYIESELLPQLRERSELQRKKVDYQLSQWQGEAGKCSFYLFTSGADIPAMKYLPAYNMEEIHSDVEKMFISQLRASLTAAFSDYGQAVPSVRANVGCGCINTLLGNMHQTYFPDKMPWLLEHYTADEFREFTKASIADSDQFSFGLECMRFMKEKLEGTGIEVYPMDIQGPVDMAHLWLGDDFFYDVYDEPELVHQALSLSVECIDYAFRRNLEIIAPTDHLCHYNCITLPIEKPLKLSEDTSTLLCGDHLHEYMLSYSSELFRRFGGGYIHYCGDNRHLLPITETIPGSMGLNFGNPERHNIAEVLDALSENGKFYIITGNAQPIPNEKIVEYAARPDGSFNTTIASTVRAADAEAVYYRHLENIEKFRKNK